MPVESDVSAVKQNRSKKPPGIYFWSINYLYFRNYYLVLWYNYISFLGNCIYSQKLEHMGIRAHVVLTQPYSPSLCKMYQLVITFKGCSFTKALLVQPYASTSVSVRLSIMLRAQLTAKSPHYLYNFSKKEINHFSKWISIVYFLLLLSELTQSLFCCRRSSSKHYNSLILFKTPELDVIFFIRIIFCATIFYFFII